MTFDAKQFLLDHSVPIRTEGENAQPGWIQINCPFCNDQDYHGGFNIERGYYNCWRCGWHSLSDIISTLTNCDYFKAKKILKEYDHAGKPEYEIREPFEGADRCSLPSNAKPLKTRSKDYLTDRNFDPEKLEKEWGLKATDYHGDYRFRIIAPIYLDEVLVSYQGRDYTEQATIPYKACKKKDEVIHHKHTLYGIDKIQNKKAIIVEGIADAWRIGPGAVATFGTGFTTAQVNMMLDRLDEIYILFDVEQEAQERADSLSTNLSGYDRKVEILELVKGDPADLSDQEAKQIRKAVLG